MFMVSTTWLMVNLSFSSSCFLPSNITMGLLAASLINALLGQHVSLCGQLYFVDTIFKRYEYFG